MTTTSASLLERVRRPSEQGAWERFVSLYTPLLYNWACRLGVQEQDARDLIQDVFTTLVQKLPDFQYDRQKSFRSWLRTVLLNKWRDRVRLMAHSYPKANDAALAELAARNEGDAVEEEEYRRHLVSRALELMQAEFAPNTWKACWEHVVGGKSAADVAKELGISPGSVYVAKSRVMHRLRQELDGLMD